MTPCSSIFDARGEHLPFRGTNFSRSLVHLHFNARRGTNPFSPLCSPPFRHQEGDNPLVLIQEDRSTAGRGRPAPPVSFLDRVLGTPLVRLHFGSRRMRNPLPSSSTSIKTFPFSRLPIDAMRADDTHEPQI